MGFLRSFGVVILSILLTSCIIVAGIFFMISMSLNEGNVKDGLKGIFQQTLADEERLDVTTEGYQQMLLYCGNNSEFLISEGDFSANVSCEAIKRGPDAVVDEYVDNSIEEIYYAEYDCNSIGDCVEMSSEKNQGFPTYLVSKQFRDYCMGKFYLALLLIIVFLVLIFLLVEDKKKFFTIVGPLMIMASIPFFLVEKIAKIIVGEEIMSMAGLFLSKSMFVFMSILFFGIALLIVGIVWGIVEWVGVREESVKGKKK